MPILSTETGIVVFCQPATLTKSWCTTTVLTSYGNKKQHYYSIPSREEEGGFKCCAIHMYVHVHVLLVKSTCSIYCTTLLDLHVHVCTCSLHTSIHAYVLHPQYNMYMHVYIVHERMYSSTVRTCTIHVHVIYLCTHGHIHVHTCTCTLYISLSCTHPVHVQILMLSPYWSAVAYILPAVAYPTSSGLPCQKWLTLPTVAYPTSSGLPCPSPSLFASPSSCRNQTASGPQA